MLIGPWRNIKDLEESLNLPELELVVSAARDREERNNRWLAAVNGVDLSQTEGQNAKEKVEEMKRRREALDAGKTFEEFEFDEFGIEIEVEE